MIQDSVKDRFEALRGVGTEDILSALGLARKRSMLDVLLPAAGIFVAGVAIGTGVALLLAPKSGEEMRRDIKEKANALTERLGSTAGELAQDVRESLARAEDARTASSGNGTLSGV